MLKFQKKIFLLKTEKNGDVRKESRTIDFLNYLNTLLRNESSTSFRNLNLETFSIISLTKIVGLVEWCENTSTVKTLVENIWRDKKQPLDFQ